MPARRPLLSLLYFQVPDPRPDVGDGGPAAPLAATTDPAPLRVLGAGEQMPQLVRCLQLPPQAELPEVFAALSAYQRSRGLKADGLVGPYLWSLLDPPKAAQATARWSSRLSTELLAKLFPNTALANLRVYAPYVLAALDAAGLGPQQTLGPLMCKMALATIGAETEGFMPWAEQPSRFNTPAPAIPGGQAFGLYDPPGPLAKALGNTQAGDGALFKGRGFVQLTGRDHYVRLGEQIGLPLAERPFLANLPEAAAVVLVALLQQHQSQIAAALAKDQNTEPLAQARRIVNGGQHGLERFEDVCTRWDRHVAPTLARPGRGRRSVLQQQGFDFQAFSNPDARLALPVKADAVDLRDLPYQPPLGSLPEVYPAPERVAGYWPLYRDQVLDQGREGACTGFGLACLVNYLRFSQAIVAIGAGRPPKAGHPALPPRVSPRMLYEFARCYDEFAGNDYEGSSCRGALKGWFKHGVCTEADWPYAAQQPLVPDWSQRALDISLGVYYRVDRSNLVDMQAAIANVGALFVSATVHEGWGALPQAAAEATPITHASLPVINFQPDSVRITGAHAFALVGYNRQGFIVQNSWGSGWGHSGFAVLRYDDWLAHGMDAWAATLGVPGVVNNAATVPAAVGAAGSAIGLAGLPSQLYQPPPSDLGQRHSLVLDRGMPCHLSGNDRLQPGSLGTLGEDWPAQWFKARVAAGQPARLVLYAHGGLNGEATGIARARAMAKAFLDNGCYPLFLVWRTGPLESLFNLLKGQPAPSEPRATGNMLTDNTIDPFLEMSLGPTLARALWDEMKFAASQASTESGGLTQLANALQSLLAQVPGLEVHLVGHSAGSLLLGHMLPVLSKRRIPIASAHLYAPACTVSFANNHWLPYVGPRDASTGRFPLSVHVLSDELEREDGSCVVYRKSLLYFVARGIESPQSTPLLGMEGSWTPGKVFRGWNGSAQTLADLAALRRTWTELQGQGLSLQVWREPRVACRTDASGQPQGRGIDAEHGSFDNNAQVVLGTLNSICGGTAPQPELNLSFSP